MWLISLDYVLIGDWSTSFLCIQYRSVKYGWLIYVFMLSFITLNDVLNTNVVNYKAEGS
jgi:hypothetical protein